MKRKKTMDSRTARRRNRTSGPVGRFAVLAAGLFIYTAHAAGGAPASAMQILAATDHAELTAEISGTAVNRIALIDDRIAWVIRAPGGYAAEHDPANGDLYLRPLAAHGGGDIPGEPVTLFLGTEKGFTYRLALTVSDRDSAQILIRDPDAAASVETGGAKASDPRVSALVRLIRAVARREPPPGYAIEAGDGDGGGIAQFIEIWRGPRFMAGVLETAPHGPADAPTLAALYGPDIAAAWLSAPGTGPTGGRLAVVVHDVRGAGARR